MDMDLTPLMRKAISGTTKDVQKMIDDGAIIDEMDDANYTALHWAVALGSVGTMKVLVKAGANIETRNKWGNTPFICSGDRTLSSKARLLIKHGANVNASNDEGQTALSRALASSKFETANFIIEAGADMKDVNIDSHGIDLFFSAISMNKIENVKKLIELGYDVNSTKNKYNNALINAVRKGHLEIAKILIEAGADVNAKDINGWTALTHALKMDYSTETIKLLIDAGAKLSNKFLGLAIRQAKRKGKTEIVEILEGLK